MDDSKRKIIIHLGKCLKSLRKSKHKSLNMFAYENDLTTATVSRVENGLVDLKFTTLIKYAQGLEIPLEDILAELHIDYNYNE